MILGGVAASWHCQKKSSGCACVRACVLACVGVCVCVCVCVCTPCVVSKRVASSFCFEEYRRYV